MTFTETLIAHNVGYLEQGRLLLGGLEEEVYTSTQPPYHESSIGDHLRHCLEHYGSFLDGYAQGAIDYDGRRRDKRIATCRVSADKTIQNLIERLNRITPTDKLLRVKMDCDEDAASIDPWSKSSIRRELQYLLAHTVHHYALIAVILRLQGVETHRDFGVAPSTLRHRKRQSTAP